MLSNKSPIIVLLVFSVPSSKRHTFDIASLAPNRLTYAKQIMLMISLYCNGHEGPLLLNKLCPVLFKDVLRYLLVGRIW